MSLWYWSSSNTTSFLPKRVNVLLAGLKQNTSNTSSLQKKGAADYSQIVKGYGAMARPLTELPKKDNFNWSKAVGVAFQELKKAISTTPV